MASTGSPTCSCVGSPRRTGTRPCAGMRKTAISVAASLPSTLAVYSRRSAMRTVTDCASFTTWALVSTRPSADTMKPEPWPRKGCAPCGCMRRQPGGRPSPSPASATRLPSTVMPTTDGPNCCTMARKLGAAAGGMVVATAALAAGRLAAAIATGVLAGCCHGRLKAPALPTTARPPPSIAQARGLKMSRMVLILVAGRVAPVMDLHCEAGV